MKKQIKELSNYLWERAINNDRRYFDMELEFKFKDLISEQNGRETKK